MPNWCNNSIAFFQEDGGNALLDAFYTDIQKYQNYIDPETGNASSWIGHWLESNRVDIKNLYTRGFLSNIELNDTHVRIDMETAWAPLPEIWDLMAEKYELSYVYIAEECGCEVYVNTDADGKFFTTRYVLNYFDVDDLELDDRTMAEYGERLRGLGGETTYFDSWKEVEVAFEDFGFTFTDIDGLNKRLDAFRIRVYEYSSE